MALWCSRARRGLSVTLHGQVEMANALSLAAHRGLLDPSTLRSALDALDDDFATGRLHLIDLHWRTVLKKAGELSRTYSATLGTRSLDVLHVASALETGLQVFVTFDLRQQNLARAVGLRVFTPRT